MGAQKRKGEKNLDPPQKKFIPHFLGKMGDKRIAAKRNSAAARPRTAMLQAYTVDTILSIFRSFSINFSHFRPFIGLFWAKMRVLGQKWEKFRFLGIFQKFSYFHYITKLKSIVLRAPMNFLHNF